MTTTTVCAGSGTAAGRALVAEDAGALPGEGCLPTAVVADAEPGSHQPDHGDLDEFPGVGGAAFVVAGWLQDTH